MMYINGQERCGGEVGGGRTEIEVPKPVREFDAGTKLFRERR